jgi:hypothetical protein
MHWHQYHGQIINSKPHDIHEQTNRIFSDAGTFGRVSLSNGTSITENSVTQKHVILTSRRTEYSRMQVPLDIKWHLRW